MKKLVAVCLVNVVVGTMVFAADKINFANDAMSVADGSGGTVDGWTLTANLTKDDYQRGGRTGDGWYVGAKIKWPQKSNGTYASIENNAKIVRSDNSRGEISNETSTKGLYTFRKSTTWWELVTAEDLYAAQGEDITRTVTLSGSAPSPVVIPATTVPATDFKISIPTAGLTELKDSSGVVRFPAVAVKNGGEKVWGDLAVAIRDGDAGSLTIDCVADGMIAEPVEVTDGSSFRLNRGEHEITGLSNLTLKGGTYDFNPAEAGCTIAQGYAAYDKGDGTWGIKVAHQHSWSFTGEGTSSIVATCENVSCTIPGGQIAVGLVAESRDYDGTAFAATVTNAEAFAGATALVVGEVRYYDVDGDLLAGAPKLTGDYAAKVSVGEMTLVQTFSIIKPADGYTDGWELAKVGVDESKWVRYDTCPEAASFAADGETVIYRGGYDGERELNLTSDFDITVDLNEQRFERRKYAEMELYNTGDGVVTLVNGTIKQPTDGIFVEDIVFIGSESADGSFVLGAGLTLENAAIRPDSRLKVRVKYTELGIVDGCYQIREFGTSNDGTVVITGGRFRNYIEKDRLASFVPKPYVVNEVSGDYEYEVVRPPLNLQIPVVKTGFTYVVSNETSELKGTIVDGMNTYQVSKDSIVKVYFTLAQGYRFEGEPENPKVIKIGSEDVVLAEDDLPAALRMLVLGEAAGPYDTFFELLAARGKVCLVPTDEVRAELAGSTLLTETDYLNMFDQTYSLVEGKYYIFYELTKDGLERLALSESAVTTNLNPLAISELPSGESTPLVVAGGLPGFYYTLYDGVEVTNLTADPNETNRNVLCRANGTVTFGAVRKPSDAAGFFTVGAKAAGDVEAGQGR